MCLCSSLCGNKNTLTAANGQKKRKILIQFKLEAIMQIFCNIINWYVMLDTFKMCWEQDYIMLTKAVFIWLKIQKYYYYIK